MSELGFRNCDDICMCVANNSLNSSSLSLIPFMLTCSIMRFLSLLLLVLCACVVSVVMWSSLVCLGTLYCVCSGCVDCDACYVVCV